MVNKTMRVIHVLLKELRNYNSKLFLCSPQITGATLEKHLSNFLHF